MDYYFSAASDEEALKAKDLPAGPMPGTEGYDTVEAKGVLATALEELVAMSKGSSSLLVMAGTHPLWPEYPSNLEDYEPGSFLTRSPDNIRDELSDVEVTPALATKWADEIFGYELAEAERVAKSIIQLARGGRDRNRSIYWWSEM
jgi:hypothetical protein